MRCRRVALLVATASLLTALGGCSQAPDTGPSWIERSRVSETLDPAAVPDFLAPGGGCAVAEAPPPGSEPVVAPPQDAGDGGTDNDPYTATGARQVPGPGMRLAAPPEQPVTVVVGRPADPDEHVAARNPDGEVTGPVPPPKPITTAPPAASPAAPPVTSPAPTPTDPSAPEAPDAPPCQPGSGF